MSNCTGHAISTLSSRRARYLSLTSSSSPGESRARATTKINSRCAAMEPAGSLLDNAVGVGDLVLLDPLSEKSIVSNLQQRFQHDFIYTYIGNVVVSLNPYKSMPIYTPAKIEQYRNSNMFELPPHMGHIVEMKLFYCVKGDWSACFCARRFQYFFSTTDLKEFL
uniref:unconventional myosin-Ib-like n=1 Tax=Myxine glutinosa TaxID=7769 RepID=UPI00359018C7